MNTNNWIVTAAMSALMIVGSSVVAGPIVTYDFETEDDLVTPLAHGQIVDPAFDAIGQNEFGTIFNVSSTQDGSDGHLGVTVFDSDLSGTLDPDLEVGNGNILILQNDSHSSRTGDFYDNPNDEASLNDNGSIVFDFNFPLGPKAITIVDGNGGFGATLTLTDNNSLTRTYSIPQRWTTDVTQALNGFQALDLTTLAPQPSEPNATGGDATAVEDAGFDQTMVVQLRMAFHGSGGQGATTSGGIDNLVLEIPEPATGVLFASLLVGLGMTRRR